MSDLYKEAIADAKKLRELAEEEARKSIIESVSPYIKKMIAKETANASTFFFEEEEDASLQPPDKSVTSPETAIAGTDSPVVEPASGSESVGDSLGSSVTDNPALDAPIASAGSEIANVPMPDADGKITIDFEQLFSDGALGDTVPPVATDAIAPDTTDLTAAPEAPAPIQPTAADGTAGDSLSGGEETPAPAPNDIASPETLAATPEPTPPSMDTGEIPGSEEEEEVPSAAQPLTEAKFNEQLMEASFRIDQIFHGGSNGRSVSDLMHERLKNNLIDLLESLDNMQASGVISEGKARHNEKRLEFLFLKLKEGILANSYTTEKDKKEDPMGKSLKEYAAKLFESDEQERLAQDSISTGETGLPVRKDASAHAKKVSGVSPEVGDLFKEEGGSGEGKTVRVAAKAGTTDAAPLTGTGTAKKMPLEKGEPIAEEIEAKGHAGFGDSNEKPVASPDMFFEIDEKELMEAVAAIRKEAASADKPAAAKATKAGWEKGKPAGKSAAPAAVLKKTAVNEQVAEMGDLGGGGMDEDLVLNIALPDEIEDELSSDDLDVDLMLSSDEDGLDAVSPEDGEGLDVDGGAADDMDMVDADEDSSVDMDMMDSDESDSSSEEEEVLLTDEEEDLDEVSDPMTGPASDLAPRPIKESKIVKTLRVREAKARKLLEARSAEAKQLKTEMAETNLFLSKLLYLNKFLQKEGLSRKVKQQIVEHLDRASTLAEAKEIYLKIKKKLDESVGSDRPSASMVGSASKPTAAGSARLNESANALHSDSEHVLGTVERWQKLARIKKGED